MTSSFWVVALILSTHQFCHKVGRRRHHRRRLLASVRWVQVAAVMLNAHQHCTRVGRFLKPSVCMGSCSIAQRPSPLVEGSTRFLSVSVCLGSCSSDAQRPPALVQGSAASPPFIVDNAHCVPALSPFAFALGQGRPPTPIPPPPLIRSASKYFPDVAAKLVSSLTLLHSIAVSSGACFKRGTHATRIWQVRRS